MISLSSIPSLSLSLSLPLSDTQKAFWNQCEWALVWWTWAPRHSVAPYWKTPTLHSTSIDRTGLSIKRLMSWPQASLLAVVLKGSLQRVTYCLSSTFQMSWWRQSPTRTSLTMTCFSLSRQSLWRTNHVPLLERTSPTEDQPFIWGSLIMNTCEIEPFRTSPLRNFISNWGSLIMNTLWARTF